MHRQLPSLFAVLLLTACQQVTPQAAPASSASSSAVSVPATTTPLVNLSLPGGWKSRVDGSNAVTFMTPAVYKPYNDASIDHDFFRVQMLGNVACTEAYAAQEVHMQWGETIPKGEEFQPFMMDGRTVGYTWLEFGGVGIQPGDKPDHRHWCVHAEQTGADLDIDAMQTDTTTVQFVTQTFIPLWLEHAKD